MASTMTERLEAQVEVGQSSFGWRALESNQSEIPSCESGAGRIQESTQCTFIALIKKPARVYVVRRKEDFAPRVVLCGRSSHPCLHGSEGEATSTLASSSSTRIYISPPGIYHFVIPTSNIHFNTPYQNMFQRGYYVLNSVVSTP